MTKLYRDTLGRLGFVVAPTDSTDASYQYDLHDGMKRASLNGQIRLWTRDGLGRVVSEQQPESGLTSFPPGGAFDAMGNVLRRVDADGRIFDSTFDPAGRLRTVSGTEPGQPQRMLTRLTYDQADHGTYAASNPTTSEQWNCLDGACDLVTREDYWTGLSGRLGTNRLTQSACGLVLEGGIGHDELGLERVRWQPEIVAAQCAFAKLLHLPEIWTNYAYGLPVSQGHAPGDDFFVKLIAYAPSGAPNLVRLGNDVVETTQHDALMRIASISVAKDSNVLWESGQYAYDGASNIISLGPTAERPLAQTFGYDLAGRLKTAVMPGVGTFSHFYDPWGNMTASLLAHGSEPECVPGGFFGWGQFTGREYFRGQDGAIEAIPTNRTSSLGSTCPRYSGAQVTCGIL